VGGISPQIVEFATASVTYPVQEGLVFPQEGGLSFGPEDAPLTFPSVAPANAAGLFPSYLPNAEQIVWDALNDATQCAAFFPDDGEGLPFPITFETPPNLGLFADIAPGSEENPVSLNGINVVPIKIVKGWPAYPGVVPQIGVAIATENEDGAGRLGQGGFAADAVARDESGNIVASASYYAEPLYSVVVVELIHENRDERDRLHDQLRRALYPLRHLVPGSSSIVKELAVQSEKTDLPVDEQPLTIYVSLFTVEVWSEALIPTAVQVNPAIIGPINVAVEPVTIEFE
jgi:hypothetical protein